MVKEHNVKVKIINNTRFVMRYVNDWYESGRLADTYSWPDFIRSGEKAVVLNYERNWALSGCSGYVTYEVDGTNITTGFSNPFVGTNKLGVGSQGKGVWKWMSSHGYQPFNCFVRTKNSSAVLLFDLKCTGGSTNVCDVAMETANYSQSVIWQVGVHY